MASPVVESVSAWAQNTGSPATQTLPSGVQAGDLLISIMTADRDRAVTVDSDFTELLNSPDDDDLTRTIVCYRKATGTAADTPAHTTDPEESTGIMLRISGAADPATQAPQIQSALHAAPPDPPSISPTGGSKDYLFIVGYGCDDGFNGSGAPTDYTGFTDDVYSSEVSCGIAYRQLTASSENPGTFAGSGDTGQVAFVIAIHPGSGGAAANPHGPLGHPLHGPLFGPIGL